MGLKKGGELLTEKKMGGNFDFCYHLELHNVFSNTKYKNTKASFSAKHFG